MNHRSFGPLLAAMAATPAFAGIVGGSGSVSLMQTASGYVDIQSGGEFTADLVSIENPTAGSFLFLAGGIPGTERFLGRVEFAGITGPVARFESRNEMEVDPFALPANDWAFSGNRIRFTTDVPVAVTLLVEVETIGAGAAFLEIYGDGGLVYLSPSTGPWSLDLALDAGTHTIAWGALAGPMGGSASAEGSLSITFIPAPGVLATLAAAWLVGGRVRRRG